MGCLLSRLLSPCCGETAGDSCLFVSPPFRERDTETASRLRLGRLAGPPATLPDAGNASPLFALFGVLPLEGQGGGGGTGSFTLKGDTMTELEVFEWRHHVSVLCALMYFGMAEADAVKLIEVTRRGGGREYRVFRSGRPFLIRQMKAGHATVFRL